MTELNLEYDWSYKVLYQSNLFENKNLIEYRDEILNRMYLLNETRKKVLKKMKSQKHITRFLMNCYYFVDKAMY